MKTAETVVKDGVIHTQTPESEESKLYFNMLSELRGENERLRANIHRHEISEKTYIQNEATRKKQIVDLQAQLLASQDRVIELQAQLLAVRQIAAAPIGSAAAVP